MKQIFLFPLILILSGFSGIKRIEIITSYYDNFSLSFETIGLGYNTCLKSPNLYVKGVDYIYLLQQKGSFGQEFKKTDTICIGTLRTQSIDSIVNILNDINDTLIFRNNINIYSGAAMTLKINYDKKHIEFSMKNKGDKVAQRIIDILNSNLPSNENKLFIWRDN